MKQSTEGHLVRFSRIKIKNLAAFLDLHHEALAAQASYGINEDVFQSVMDPNELTIQVTGPASAVSRWLHSAERKALAMRLELEGSPESWETTELVDPR